MYVPSQRNGTKEMHPRKPLCEFVHSLRKNPLAIKLTPLRYAQTKLLVFRIFLLSITDFKGTLFYMLKFTAQK
jgi:hypothetical protein